MSDLQNHLLEEFRHATSTISKTLDEHNLRLISLEDFTRLINQKEQMAFMKGQMTALQNVADNIKL